MTDWLLGGCNSYPVDGQACLELIEVAPGIRELARASRSFLESTVKVLARDFGVRKFIHVNFGLPMDRNVHHVAQGVRRSAKVVYLDSDPVALAYGRIVLEENDRTRVVEADITSPRRVFSDPAIASFLADGEPVAVLFVDVLTGLARIKRAAQVVAETVAALPPASFLVVGQLVSEDPQLRATVGQFMRDWTGAAVRVREEREVAAWFDGLELVSPGLVELGRWGLDMPVDTFPAEPLWKGYGGVGQKREA